MKYVYYMPKSLILVFLVWFYFGCGGQEQAKPIYYSPEVKAGHGGEGQLPERLPWAFTGEISTFGDEDVAWNIVLKGFEYSTPPQKLSITISYKKNVDGLMVFGRVGSELEYWYAPREKQPFIEIVDYIHSHPDAFFDYLEFDGEELLPGYAMDPNQERFYLKLRNYQVSDEDHYYAIGRWPDMGNGPIPEVEHVISMIKDTYLDELLQHPWE